MKARKATALAVSEENLDWEALAALLLDRHERAAFVVDRDGVVRACNRAAEKLLGWKRERVSGLTWSNLFGTGGASQEFPLDEALRGSSSQFETIAVGRDGSLFVLGFELSAVGSGTAIIATVVQATSFPGFDGVEPLGELHYEISSAPDQLGILKRVWGTNPSMDATAAMGEHCYRGLFGRTVPCDGCPIFETSRTRTRIAVIPPSREHQSVRTLIVRKTDSSTLYVRSQSINDTLLSELVRGKIIGLGMTAGLSDRERDVLEFLLLGRTVEEIGEVLGISPRTVRFHQTNLLTKLGADSRLDLIRLIL